MNDTANADDAAKDMAQSKYNVSLMMSLVNEAEHPTKFPEEKVGELPEQNGRTVNTHGALQDVRGCVEAISLMVFCCWCSPWPHGFCSETNNGLPKPV